MQIKNINDAGCGGAYATAGVGFGRAVRGVKNTLLITRFRVRFPDQARTSVGMVSDGPDEPVGSLIAPWVVDNATVASAQRLPALSCQKSDGLHIVFDACRSLV